MKIVLFSDLHAHPFRPYATILPSGMNSRLADAVSCVRQVLQVARDHEADLVLCGGDLFHVRRNINVMAFNAVYEAMAEFSLRKIPVVILPGNHDQADREGDVHSVHAFRAFCTVVDKPGWVTVTGRSGANYAIMAIPYTENVEHLRHVVKTPCPAVQIPRLFLGHLGIQGAKVGADFVYSNPHDASIDDLATSEFDAGYLGHYHLHQQVGDFWYIGAPLQHNWGDKGQWRGCLVYDTETGTHKRVTLESPRFVEMTDADLKSPINTSDSYVRLISSSVLADEDREELRLSLKARSLEIIEPKNGYSKASVPARLQMGPSMSYRDMMEMYVKSGVHHANDLDAEYLMQLGAGILEEVESE